MQVQGEDSAPSTPIKEPQQQSLGEAEPHPTQQLQLDQDVQQERGTATSELNTSNQCHQSLSESQDTNGHNEVRETETSTTDAAS